MKENPKDNHNLGKITKWKADGQILCTDIIYLIQKNKKVRMARKKRDN